MKFDLFGYRVTIEKPIRMEAIELKFDIDGIDWMTFSGTYTLREKDYSEDPSLDIKGYLKDFKDGDQGYTYPWALYQDQEGQYWIDDTIRCINRRSGTCQMLVVKQNGEYIVDVFTCKDKIYWDKRFGHSENPIKVSKVIGR